MVEWKRKAAAVMLALSPAPVAAQDAAVGSALAVRWCMGCHVIEREPLISPRNGVPTFSAIAANPATTVTFLRRYLSAEHTYMPDFALSPQERDDLIAYIMSLR